MWAVPSMTFTEFNASAVLSEYQLLSPALRSSAVGQASSCSSVCVRTSGPWMVRSTGVVSLQSKRSELLGVKCTRTATVSASPTPAVDGVESARIGASVVFDATAVVVMLAASVASL